MPGSRECLGFLSLLCLGHGSISINFWFDVISYSSPWPTFRRGCMFIFTSLLVPMPGSRERLEFSPMSWSWERQVFTFCLTSCWMVHLALPEVWQQFYFMKDGYILDGPITYKSWVNSQLLLIQDSICDWAINITYHKYCNTQTNHYKVQSHPSTLPLISPRPTIPDYYSFMHLLYTKLGYPTFSSDPN